MYRALANPSTSIINWRSRSKTSIARKDRKKEEENRGKNPGGITRMLSQNIKK